MIVLFCLFAVRLFWDACRVSDRFGRLLLIGIGTLVSVPGIREHRLDRGRDPAHRRTVAFRELRRHGACGVPDDQWRRGERHEAKMTNREQV